MQGPSKFESIRTGVMDDRTAPQERDLVIASIEARVASAMAVST